MTLEVHSLGKRLGGREVLDELDLSCRASDVVVVTGANGSGKTTLLRILGGMLEPTRGSVVVCGHCLRRDPLAARAHLGYVPDGLETLPELLVSEFLHLVETLKAHAAKPRPVVIDERWRELLGVNATWGQRLTSLSFGQRKRVFVLAALTGQPDLLLLDEPTNGLDVQGVGLMRQLVDERRKAGLITVLSTNDVEFQNQVGGINYHLPGLVIAGGDHRKAGRREGF